MASSMAAACGSRSVCVRLFRSVDGVRWALLDPQDANPIIVGDIRRTADDAVASLRVARACAIKPECYKRGGTGFALVDDSGIILAGRGGFRDEHARDAAIALVRSTLPHAPLDEVDATT
jgi:hypothetical protein